MQVFSARVIEPVGFHARPAAVAVSQANQFESRVELCYGERAADMKSIIEIMKMGIPEDARIEIRCCGADEQKAAEAIGQVLQEKKVIEIE